MQADVPDSDGDGVLDDIDESPETRPNVVVDAKGCEVIIEGGEALEMEFNGLFLPKSSQLPVIYNEDFETMAQSIHNYPEASVFIFGHADSNEIDRDIVATFGFDSLSRNRALIIKNVLVSKYNIDAERISTYDCSNKDLVVDTDNIDRNFQALALKDIKSKQSRVTLLVSSEVTDLMNLEYVSYTRKYGEYAKHCELFE